MGAMLVCWRPLAIANRILEKQPIWRISANSCEGSLGSPTLLYKGLRPGIVTVEQVCRRELVYPESFLTFLVKNRAAASGFAEVAREKMLPKDGVCHSREGNQPRG